MLIALVIAGMLAGGLNLAFRTALDADDRVHRALAASQEVRIVLNALRADVEQTSLTADSTRSWFIGTDDNDGERDTDSLRFVSRSRRVPLQDVSLPDDWESQPHHADWSGVTWSLTPVGTAEEIGVFRREECPPGEDPYEEIGEDELLSPTVVGLNCRYFDGTDWVDSWDTTGDNAGTLPSMVEVALTFQPDPELEEQRTVTAVFPIRILPPEPPTEEGLDATGTLGTGGTPAGGGQP